MLRRWLKTIVWPVAWSLVAGRMVARVLGGGVELYRSPTFTAASSPGTSGALDISNVSLLQLEFLDDGSNDSDWSVWIDPQVSRNQTAVNSFAAASKVILV